MDTNFNDILCWHTTRLYNAGVVQQYFSAAKATLRGICGDSVSISQETLCAGHAEARVTFSWKLADSQFIEYWELRVRVPMATETADVALSQFPIPVRVIVETMAELGCGYRVTRVDGPDEKTTKYYLEIPLMAPDLRTEIQPFLVIGYEEPESA